MAEQSVHIIEHKWQKDRKKKKRAENSYFHKLFLKRVTMYRLVLCRHGESQYGEKNLFCGWHDSDLCENGVKEAKMIGKRLKDHGLDFDIAYTSVLKRAIKSLYHVQEEMNLHWLPVERSWRLCERHYGALQGLSKSQTARQYGEEQVKNWRRSYEARPPPLEQSDDRWAGKSKAFKTLLPPQVPACESLSDTVARVMPLWYDQIAPTIMTGQRVLILAHGSGLRCLIKHLDSFSDAAIEDLDIPNGLPLVYDLDKDLKPLRHYYLASEDELRAGVEKVVNQGKVNPGRFCTAFRDM